MSQSDVEKMVAVMKETCLFAFLATCDGDQPVVRPVSPIIEDDATIWVTTFAGSRKVKQICRNQKVCLAFVVPPGGDKEAIVTGEAEIVTSKETKARVWKLATFDLAQYFPDGPESGDFCLLRINAKRIVWRETWDDQSHIYELL